MNPQAADANATPGQPRVWIAELAVIGMALVWGVNYSVIKYGTGVIPPLAYNGVRVTLGAMCLLAIALVWGGTAPNKRDALTIIALGALGNGVYQIFFAEGISRTRAGEAALVVGASPALMALIGRMRGVERVGMRGVVGIVLSITGVGLVVLGAARGGGARGGSLTGDLLVLVGSVCWATYTILLIPYTKRLSGWYILAYSMIGGSLVLVIAGGRAIMSVNWIALPGATWAAILYSSLGALVFAYMLWYRGVKVLGPTRTSLYGNFQTLIALLVAWITLHETPTTWQAVGALTIVGGVLLTRAPATEQS
jgi:drug/metabolite transporter (DMT)-like permease